MATLRGLFRYKFALLHQVLIIINRVTKFLQRLNGIQSITQVSKFFQKLVPQFGANENGRRSAMLGEDNRPFCQLIEYFTLALAEFGNRDEFGNGIHLAP